LTEHGELVALLALIESAPPVIDSRAWMRDPRWLSHFASNARWWFQDMMQQPPEIWRDRFRKRVQNVCKSVSTKLARGARTEREAPALGDVVDMAHYPKEYVPYAQAHWKALTSYRPKPYAGRITLFRARKQPLRCFSPGLGWEHLAGGGVNVNIVPGTHDGVLEEPVVQVLAHELRASIVEARLREARQETSAAGGAQWIRHAAALVLGSWLL
jgi:thioesterase domain-containing protein